VSAYIIRRLLLAVLIIFLVTLIVFFIMRLLPGDPLLLLITSGQQKQQTAEQLEHLRHEFGLDKHLVLQYFDWMKGLLHGDLGDSILNRTPVLDELLLRLPVTLHIGGLAFIIGNIIGIPAGIICAVRRGGWLDVVVTTLANLGITVPNFWLGILMIYAFGLYLKWLPIMGYTSPFDDFWLSTRQIIMPVICLALFPIAGTARQVRSSMLEVMHQDYVRTAWSKGLTERAVIVKHALKNGLIPIVTLAGMFVPIVIGGSVFIETVFNIPGIGRLAVTSVINQDYPYVQGVTLLVATTVVLANLAVDVAYGWLDPRIRYE
jgi:peptide/nickel transport system permease protein